MDQHRTETQHRHEPAQRAAGPDAPGHPLTGQTGAAGPASPQRPVAPSPRPGRSSGWGKPVAAGVLGAVLASAGTFGIVRATDPGPQVTAAPSVSSGAVSAGNASLTIDSGAWAQVADRAMPSTVSISVGSGGQQAGSGSGVVWDTAGHVVTNAHVVAGAEEVEVTLSNGRTYTAEVVGVDTATDLAVLRLADAPGDLTPIPIGDDQDLVVGDDVMAIGNPLGLSGTVTTGIISALDRPVTTASAEEGQQGTLPGQGTPAEAVVTNAIQTSAPINPGNSGGALVDAEGNLVGINSSIASLSSGGGQAGSIGIGFAIPVTKVEAIAAQLIETGTAEHAYLGVGVQDATAEVDSATLDGAGVASVEDGTPAAEAGLQEGDVITAIDGDRVGSAAALIGQVRERSVASEATITYVRDGAETEATVTLQTRPDTTG